MVAQAVHQLGHETRVLEPDEGAPCAVRLAHVMREPLDDPGALEQFFAQVDVATFDSENIPAGPLQPWAPKLRPSWQVLHTTQDRRREKAFLATGGFMPVQHVVVEPHASLAEAIAQFGYPCIVKTAQLGYDGKGQSRVTTEAQAQALELTSAHGWVLEEVLELEAEVSCLVARSETGEAVAFPLFENVHQHHVLDLTVVPARIDADLQRQARERAMALAQALGVVGLLTVEYFIGRGRDGVRRLYVNELAPRVHNSGHVTRRACNVSQFDLLARVLVGAPLVSPTLRPGGFAMGQLLGDVWLAQRREGGALNFSAWAARPEIEEVFLYGKTEARRGRKMGHFTVQAPSADAAAASVLSLRALLTSRQ
jgi:5-(carboxyamino)imidazole ribonucleotide synthase